MGEAAKLMYVNKHFTLFDLWRSAHRKQKNTCRRTILSHHRISLGWIDRSSIIVDLPE